MLHMPSTVKILATGGSVRRDSYVSGGGATGVTVLRSIEGRRSIHGDGERRKGRTIAHVGVRADRRNEAPVPPLAAWHFAARGRYAIATAPATRASVPSPRPARGVVGGCRATRACAR